MWGLWLDPSQPKDVNICHTREFTLNTALLDPTLDPDLFSSNVLSYPAVLNSTLLIFSLLQVFDLPKRFFLLPTVSNWFQPPPTGSNRFHLVLTGSNCLWMVPTGFNWFQSILASSNWFQPVLTTWFQLFPSHFKWFHLALYCSNWY